MPEAVNGARYACQKCVNGHRTKTCQHWENEHDKLAKSLNISEVAPGASPDDIAVFARTRSAGRPKAVDLQKGKEGTTLFILLKTTIDGKETCKAVGEIDVDAEGNKKQTRKTCCSKTDDSPEDSPKTSPGHIRSKSTTSSTGQHTRKRPLNTQIGDVTYETTKKNAKHTCACGSTCTCRFCPQHPNTKATQEVMRQVANQVQQQYKAKLSGQIEFQQPFPEVTPCGGGSITGANSHIYATDDASLLESWRHQDDGTGNFFATIPLDFSSPIAGTLELDYAGAMSLQSPQRTEFLNEASALHKSPNTLQDSPDFNNFKLSTPVDSTPYNELWPTTGWIDPASQGIMLSDTSVHSDASSHPIYAQAGHELFSSQFSQPSNGAPISETKPVFMHQGAALHQPIPTPSNFLHHNDHGIGNFENMMTQLIPVQTSFNHQAFHPVPSHHIQPEPVAAARHKSCCSDSAEPPQPTVSEQSSTHAQDFKHAEPSTLDSRFSHPPRRHSASMRHSDSAQPIAAYSSAATPFNGNIPAELFAQEQQYLQDNSKESAHLFDQFWQQPMHSPPAIMHGGPQFSA